MPTTPGVPLSLQVAIGRWTARALLVLVVGGTVLSATDGEADLSLPVLLALALPLAGALALAAFAWTTPADGDDRAARRVLLGLAALSTAASLLGWLADSGDTTALLLLPLAILVAALTLTRRQHVALSGGALVVLAAGAVGLDEPSTALWPGLIIAASAVISERTAALLGQAVAEVETNRAEADASARALRAVVEAARRATVAGRDDVLAAMLDTADQLGADRAAILVPDEDGRFEELAVTTREADRGTSCPAADDALLRRAHDTATAQVVEDDPCTVLATPIVGPDGAVHGVLTAARAPAIVWADAERQALELLAEHAGHALSLSLEIGEDRRRLDEMRTIARIQSEAVAAVSHELRTPVMIVAGIAETLAEEPDGLAPDRRRHLIQRLDANGRSLSSIVSTMLDTARLERGLGAETSEEVDLAHLASSTIDRLEPLLRTHDVELRVDDGDHVARGNGALLERVVENLLTNAVRHTPHGTTIRVELERVGPRVEVRVRDHGPGMPAQVLAAVRQLTLRGMDGHRDARAVLGPTPGLGLGMALTADLLRVHDAELMVDSRAGRGTDFWFRLPAASPSTTGSAARAHAAAPQHV